MLMSGETNRVIRVTLAKEINLVELDLKIFRGINGYAMIDGDGNAPVIKKGNQVIDVFQRRAARGDDDRFLGLGNLFEQDPIVTIGTRNLQNGDSQVATHIDGALIEGRGHRNTTGGADGFHQLGKILGSKPRIHCLLDVANVVPMAKIAVNKIVDVANLQLNRRPYVVETDNLSVRADDLQASLDVSQMVVGQLEHEYLFKNLSRKHNWSRKAGRNSPFLRVIDRKYTCTDVTV